MFEKMLKVAVPAILAAATLFAPVAFAQQKTDYVYKRDLTPKGFSTTDRGVFDFSENIARTLGGSEITIFGKEITNISVNPTAMSILLLANDKKGPMVALFSTTDKDLNLHKFDNKKTDGVPTAIGYTTDARKLLISGQDSILRIYHPQKYGLLQTMKLNFAPTALLVSENGYFLAITDGKIVDVYNFETGNLRKSWDFDGVTDISFSRDNTEFAVLTSDGTATIYDTRNFLTKKTIDGLGEGRAMGYNFDGKYLAVATSPTRVEIINVLDDQAERDIIEVEEGGISDLGFISDVKFNTLLVYNAENAMKVKRLTNLAPYYGKLINEELNSMMNEWMKMLPGETMEEYQMRVNDTTREAQRKLFEAQIATGYANDLVNMATISLGGYDRSNNLLEVGFDNMPTIYLTVPETDLSSFENTKDLKFNNSKYGVLPNDHFELIYAEVFNEADGKTYIYSNLDRVNLNFMASDEDKVDLEIIQQQQMEEMRLQQLREKVVAEAKKSNVISDNTNITIDSKVVPDYDADGNRILNYLVNFTYEVEPEFSAIEDFGPGKYRIDESGAASAMMKIVKEAFEGDFAQYVRPDKKLIVNLTGTADATPIRSALKYDGVYGEFYDEPVYQNGQLTGMTVTAKEGIKTNEQLAFIRSCAVRNFLTDNVENLNQMKTDFRHNVIVSEGKGGEFRRITAEFTFVDAF